MGVLDALKGLIPAELQAAIEGEATRADAGLIRGGMAEMYISTPAATTTAQEPTFTKAAGTYALGESSGFSHASGVLTMTDPETRIYAVMLGVTAVASVNDTYAFRVAKNGTDLAKSEQRRVITGAPDVGAVPGVTCVSLAQGDELQLEVAREGAAPATCTVQRLNFVVWAVS